MVSDDASMLSSLSYTISKYVQEEEFTQKQIDWIESNIRTTASDWIDELRERVESTFENETPDDDDEEVVVEVAKVVADREEVVADVVAEVDDRDRFGRCGRSENKKTLLMYTIKSSDLISGVILT